MALITSVPPLGLLSAQVILEPGQAPRRRLTTASKFAEPTTVILWEVDVATKLYHTSSSELPVQGAAAVDSVAPATLPVVGLLQIEPFTVRGVAAEHSSFEGGGVVTHIVNVVEAGTELPKEYTLIK